MVTADEPFAAISCWVRILVASYVVAAPIGVVAVVTADVVAEADLRRWTLVSALRSSSEGLPYRVDISTRLAAAAECACEGSLC